MLVIILEFQEIPTAQKNILQFVIIPAHLVQIINQLKKIKLKVNKPWFVYILRSSKGHLYTGITTDLERRIKQHNSGTGAKCMKALGIPVKLMTFWIRKDRSSASKLESEIKGLSKENKEKLILGEYKIVNLN